MGLSNDDCSDGSICWVVRKSLKEQDDFAEAHSDSTSGIEETCDIHWHDEETAKKNFGDEGFFVIVDVKKGVKQEDNVDEEVKGNCEHIDGNREKSASEDEKSEESKEAPSEDKQLPVAIGGQSYEKHKPCSKVAKDRCSSGPGRFQHLNRFLSALLIGTGTLGNLYIVPWCTHDSVSSPSDDVILQSAPPQAFSPLGANIGGWLMLERWMGATHCFDWTADDIKSEWQLCEHLGMQECSRRVNEHRDSYMAEQDLVNLKSAGFEAIRVPFGYWLFETFPGDLFVGNGTHHLDNIVTWARRQGLRIHLDLHGVPGQQSGQHHTGRANENWEPGNLRTEDAARILGKVSERYCKLVDGIEVINEPALVIPMGQLIEYFQRAYSSIRAHGDECTVVFTIFPVERRFEIPSGAFDGMTNFAFDLHFYQIFDPFWQSLSMTSFLTQSRRQREYDIEVIQNNFGPVSVGEWTSSFPENSWIAPYPLQRDTWRKHSMTDASRRFYSCTQMHGYAAASAGSFYWSWHSSWDVGAWGAKDWIEMGFLNTSWRYEDCTALQLTASKLDAATTYTFGFVVTFDMVLGLIFLCGLPRASVMKCRQDKPASIFCRAWWSIVDFARMFWQWCTLVVRMMDFDLLWLILPLFPPEYEEDITAAFEGKTDMVDWWYAVLMTAALRVFIAICVWCVAPVGCLETMLQYTETDSNSEPVSRSTIVYWVSWITAVVSNIARGLSLFVLLRLFSHTESSPLWPSGHPLWHFAFAATMLNLILSLAQLMKERSHNSDRRCINICLRCIRALSIFMFAILGAFFSFVACFRLLATSVPWARHVFGWTGITLDALFSTKARTQ